MTVLLIIGIALAGLAVAAIISGVARSNNQSSGVVQKRIQTYGFSRRSEEAGTGAGVRERLDDVATKMGAVFASRSGGRATERLRRDLISAGMYNTTLGKFFGYRILCSVGLPLLWIWFAVTAGVSIPLTVLSTVLISVMGWVLPATLVRQRAQQRLAEIDYQLPELIDLLVVTVEAGLGFVGSLQMAAGRVTGALGQELRLTLQEQSMGLSIQEALMNLLARCDTPAMRSFVRSIVQGETLGVSIGQIMRDLAQEMRRRRRAVAQEKAQKAPIKILFPLVFLIFPSMFVVLLGPAVFLFIRSFGGG
jgi:tight adherence protein C